jgi:NifU-like protein involved in Fe-S cluster formation
VHSPAVLDHFQHPRNAGRLDEPCALGRADNPGCGDEVELSLRLASGAVAEVRFRAAGCVASIACASCLTELVRGRAAEEAMRLGRADLSAALGDLPPTAQHAAQLALDALRAALRSAGAGPRTVSPPNTVPG